jgi:cytochrome c-type biogenesis protein CcmF
VGEPFFNRLAVPLSFMILLTMGLGPVTPWRGAAPGLLWRRLRGPAIVALATGLVVALTVTRVAWVILAIVLGVWVGAAIVGLLIELAGNRSAKSGRSFYTEAKTVIRNDQPFWAGQVSHIGVALVAVGIAFAANLPLHAEVELAPGESVQFAGYTLTYEAPFRRDEPNRVVQGARVQVSQGDRVITTLEPRANFYDTEMGGIITPAVMSRPGGDLYLTMRNLDAETVQLGLDTSPMIWLVWLGGLVTASGGFWSLAARRRERVDTETKVMADV